MTEPVSNAWPWPDSLDALVAAPKHHKLVLDNERVRVLDTHIPAGDIVPVRVRRKDQEKLVQLPMADQIWQKLGVQFTAVRTDAVSQANRQLHGGLEVTAISANGAAAKAGLRKGDILVGLHSWETVSTENVTYVLNHRDLATFNPVPFFILREGQIQRGQLSVLP